MLTFDEQALKRDLDRLSPRSRVAFAACCAQRLAGVYHRFLGQRGQPQRAVDCDRALEYVWSHILKPFPVEVVEQFLADVVALIPDQDAPDWTALTAYGDDALSALAFCLSCLRSGDTQDAAWAARRVYETLDCFVMNRDNVMPADAATETRILSDSTIQAELERQARDIEDLSRAGDSLAEEAIEKLRRRSAREQAILDD